MGLSTLIVLSYCVYLMLYLSAEFYPGGFIQLFWLSQNTSFVVLDALVKNLIPEISPQFLIFKKVMITVF